ncbi:FMN-binding protein [Cellulomonas sp. McL0617]|uniref:FMN-binding protein n=1 Tax=Cellulomonas sp. McL0617 TaxID=3415675 RepID=UPI003CF9BC4C
MASRPWRGTLLFVGAAAAMTAAGVAKFAPAVPSTTSSAAAGTTSTGSTSSGTTSNGSTSSGSTSSGSTSSGSSSGATSTGTDSGSTTTSDTVTIVGSVEQNRYGNVQVSVTFTGSQITDVQTLQVPNREREDQRINQEAVPILAQEVISAQSAHIDTVSGATYTSDSYAASVQSAIDQHG